MPQRPKRCITSIHPRRKFLSKQLIDVVTRKPDWLTKVPRVGLVEQSETQHQRRFHWVTLAL